MLFNSPQFILFFFLIYIIFYASPSKMRYLVLLAGSIIFYASFFPPFLLIILFLAVTDYFLALSIEGNRKLKGAIILGLGITRSVGLLIFYKYSFFFLSYLPILSNTSFTSTSAEGKPSLIIPIGLSFYTLKSISYLIEVYKRRISSEKNILMYALYLVFFPEVVAGPISRPSSLLSQLKALKRYSYENMSHGLRLIVWGLFQKIVIADRLAATVNIIYANPQGFNPLALLIGTLFFTFQIYMDFSSYTNIVRGIGRMFGLILPENFNLPYFSTSISDFWKRWHISLTSWLREYIYFPLGGNRVNRFRLIINILIVFAISGIWHGTNTTFLVWGLLNALFLLFSANPFNSKVLPRKVNTFPEKIGNFARIMSTFLTINFLWVFFRANSLKQAAGIIIDIIFGFENVLLNPKNSIFLANNLNLKKGTIFVGIYLILIIVVAESIQHTKYAPISLDRVPLLLRWSLFYMLIFGIIFFGQSESLKFIYEQF